MCVGFGRIFEWAPVGIYHARVGDGGTCSPDTVTCPKKNAARDREIELGPAACLRGSRHLSPLGHSVSRYIGLFEAIASCLKWVGGCKNIYIIVRPQHKYHGNYTYILHNIINYKNTKIFLKKKRLFRPLLFKRIVPQYNLIIISCIHFNNILLFTN